MLDKNKELRLMAQAGNLEAVQQLLEAGIDPNCQDSSGFTPLHYVMDDLPHQTEKPVLELIKVLVAKGADIHISTHFDQTALIYAAFIGRDKAVDYLCDNGADVNKRLDTGANALHCINDELQGRPLNFTLTKTIDNKQISFTDPDEIRSLIGFHPDDQTNRYYKIITRLIDEGIDLNTPLKESQQTPIFRLANLGINDIIALYLTSGKVNLNYRDKWNSTPLHYAARAGHLETVRLLIEAGADPTAIDNYEYTPLREATEGKHKKVVALLQTYISSPTKIVDKQKISPTIPEKIILTKVTGQLLFSSHKRLLQAKDEMVAASRNDYLTEASFIWEKKSATIDIEQKTSRSFAIEGTAAIEAFAKKAMRGQIDCLLVEENILIRILAKGKRRVMRPNAPLKTDPGPILSRIQHPVSISSVAISPNEQTAALAGGITNIGNNETDITVWDLSTGEQITRLVGLKGVADGVTFSPDGRSIAAVNTKGGWRSWDWQTGKVTDRGRQQKYDRWEIYWHDGASQPEVAYHTKRAEKRKNNGRYQLQIPVAHASIIDLETNQEVAQLHFKKLAIPERLLYGQWLPNGRSVFLIGRKSICIWWPAVLATEKQDKDLVQLYPIPAEAPGYFSQWQFMPQSGKLVAATGQSPSPWVFSIDLNQPLEPVLTAWEKFKLARDSATDKYTGTLLREWSWNKQSWGYHGVHTYEGQLLWFTHYDNPHAGGGASGQSYQDFLANGPAQNPPQEIIAEIYDALTRSS